MILLQLLYLPKKVEDSQILLTICDLFKCTLFLLFLINILLQFYFLLTFLQFYFMKP